MNNFLAKTNGETIQQHTDNLLTQMDIFESIYPAVNIDFNLLRLACIHHDIGKINTKFQNRLMNIIGGYDLLKDENSHNEVHHGYLSAMLVDKELSKAIGKDKFKILMQSIYYHHTRAEHPIHEQWEADDLNTYINDFNYDNLKLTSANKNIKRYVENRINTDSPLFKEYIMTKGLLNKLDYAASSGVTVEYKPEDLNKKVINFMDNKGYKTNDLQNYMYENRDNNNIIIASTGIGKTEAALMWIGENKGFFTLPLQVSINAIYERLLKQLDVSNAGLLHGNAKQEYFKLGFGKNHLDTTRQFSLPLTVCTLDQLIDFVFKYPGFELKLATLSYSKLVIDEIQMYSPDMIAYLLLALKNITDLGGKFSILTATLPPVIVHFLKKLNVPFSEPKTFLKNTLRHRVSTISGAINIELITKHSENNKVLVICNTVKKAQQVYTELKEKGVKVNLLHSRFTRADRSKKESEIKSFNENGVWVSTQIVEASLDIDFDILHTELSELSGLFQRMGRCYRSRELKHKYTNVYVYTDASGVKFVVDEDIHRLSLEAIKNLNNTELYESSKMTLIENTFSIENMKSTNYYKTIKNVINEMMYIEAFEFSKNEAKLRDIENVNVLPIQFVDKENIEDHTISISTKVLKDKWVNDILYTNKGEVLIVKLNYDNEYGLDTNFKEEQK